MRFYFQVLIIALFFSCENEVKEKAIKNFSISELSKALVEDPNNVHLLTLRKDKFLSENRLKAALIDQKQIFALDSLNVQKRYDLASLYYRIAEEGQFEYFSKSLTLLDNSFISENNNPKHLLLRAKLYYLFQKHQLTLMDLNSCLKINPFEAEAYFYKGLVYKEFSDLEQAKSLFQTAVEQWPEFTDAYEQLAFIYAFENDTLAELYFSNAIETDSLNISLWYNKAMYHQKLMQYDHAIKCYKSMLRIDPRNVKASYNLGYINLVLENYLEAANLFSEVIFNNNSFATAYFSRGLCFKYLGRYSEAKKDFNKALKLDTNLVEAEIELKSMQ